MNSSSRVFTAWGVYGVSWRVKQHLFFGISEANVKENDIAVSTRQTLRIAFDDARSMYWFELCTNRTHVDIVVNGEVAFTLYHG